MVCAKKDRARRRGVFMEGRAGGNRRAGAVSIIGHRLISFECLAHKLCQAQKQSVIIQDWRMQEEEELFSEGNTKQSTANKLVALKKAEGYRKSCNETWLD